jgi:regulator of replication initiation timing
MICEACQELFKSNEPCGCHRDLTEIAALKAELSHRWTHEEAKLVMEEIDELKAENAKLREALEEIYLAPTDVRRAVEIAKKALGRE